MADTRSTCLRFNLDKEEYRKAWVTPHSVGRCHEVTEGTGAS